MIRTNTLKEEEEARRTLRTQHASECTTAHGDLPFNKEAVTVVAGEADPVVIGWTTFSYLVSQNSHFTYDLPRVRCEPVFLRLQPSW